MHYIGSGLYNAIKIRIKILRKYTFLNYLKARYLVTNDKILNWLSEVNPNLFYFYSKGTVRCKCLGVLYTYYLLAQSLYL